jgi:UDP-N-acetylmuramyl pentapeptide phosphotransferase/UDP-N-acetylglucosamine-1-phosphate transferase
MTCSLLAFFISFFFAALIIHTKKLHGSISGDSFFNTPQKFHFEPVPRIGGLAIFLALIASITLKYYTSSDDREIILFLLCAIPTFGIGLLEDITKIISVRIRLLFTAISATLASIFLGAKIIGLDLPIVDMAFTFPAVSIIFTVFAITGLTNAYNIIDGFNGLSSMIGIIALLALGYIGIKFNDPMIYFLSLTMAAAILGFFLLNYPKGLIFLGDGGAYLIGFWVALLSVLVVNRHQDISPWFAVMLNAYPILETLFTIYRRKLHQGKSPSHPDGIHFHSLIFRRIQNKTQIKNKSNWLNANARTAPYLWILSSLATIPAIVFLDSTPKLISFFVLFCFLYLWLYKKIVLFKTPKWMHL